MILIIDHKDSYVHSLARLVGLSGMTRQVTRYDRVTLDDIRTLKPSGIILSPGPGHPKDTGVTLDIIRQLGSDIPILGVCLGHQAIGYAFGATIAKSAPCHGRADEIYPVSGNQLLQDCPNPFEAARYHSLHIQDVDNTPLTVTARTNDGMIMAVEHKERPIFGVQFHPESCLTDCGNNIMKRFITLIGETNA